MSSLKNRWENDRESFTELPKTEFDKLFRDKQFIDGPVASGSNKFMKEFGPYNPHRWAFGELVDNRLVCCDVAAAEMQPPK